MSLVQLIREDIHRSRAAHVNQRDVWLHKGLWALIDYRIATAVGVPPARIIPAGHA